MAARSTQAASSTLAFILTSYRFRVSLRKREEEQREKGKGRQMRSASPSIKSFWLFWRLFLSLFLVCTTCSIHCNYVYMQERVHSYEMKILDVEGEKKAEDKEEKRARGRERSRALGSAMSEVLCLLDLFTFFWFEVSRARSHPLELELLGLAVTSAA